MEYLVATIVGALISALIINRPLQFKIIHHYPDPITPQAHDPLDEPDKKTQDFYEDYNAILSEITDVFGGTNETTR